MIKLYRSAINPGQWVACTQGMGWVVFPMMENGWELRRPARGLDPVHLREVPVALASETGIPGVTPSPLPHAA
jgi:hypothetical protein